jgi:3-oxo-4,17-pregnadiene-20-carboxyl-CoA hydratase beta subunit
VSLERTAPRWAEVADGTTLAPLVFPVTYTTMALDVAGTRDLYPPHHDPDAARAHGAPTVFLNTMWFQGLVGRYVTDWAGADSFLRRLSVEMRSNCGPGDVLSVTGEVRGKHQDDQHRLLVDLAVSIAKADQRVAVRAEATVELWPERDREPRETST